MNEIFFLKLLLAFFIVGTLAVSTQERLCGNSNFNIGLNWLNIGLSSLIVFFRFSPDYGFFGGTFPISLTVLAI